MTNRVKYTAICKEWKLINLHLLRQWIDRLFLTTVAVEPTLVAFH